MPICIMHNYVPYAHVHNLPHLCTVAAKKNSDVSIPFCPVQTEVKQPFHAQIWKQDGAEDGNGHVWSTIPAAASTKKKKCLESLRKPKEALLYPLMWLLNF